MIHTSLLARNPFNGTESFWHYDDVTSEATVETNTNLEQAVERNQREFNEWNDYSRMGDLVKVGSIPLNLYYKLQKEGIINDDPQQKDFFRWMRNNYHDWSKLMTAPKKVLF